MRNVFIIGSKGIPANYGGFETFVDELVMRQKSNEIKYHISCLSDKKKEVDYYGARCFYVQVPKIGSARAVYYDILALRECIQYIKLNKLKECIVYILACRIGPFFAPYVNRLHTLGCKVYVNPDGHEWKRAKWSPIIQKYWKLSERLMVKNADLLICDSRNIEAYILNDYKQYNPITKFIAYGADMALSSLEKDNETLVQWYNKNQVQEKNYYLVVGRFVPENNYETMIKEFMKTNTKKDLVLITNIEKNKFYESLKERTKFEMDTRIKFVGTVYEKELLKKIRENAFAYLHGHEVGGTNPSLIEALATTDLNLLLDVGFNKEVAEDGALYWNKHEYNLSNLINYVETLKDNDIKIYSDYAKNRMAKYYSWSFIVNQYERGFLE